MTTPYYTDDAVTLYHGDCLDVLPGLPPESIGAVVTDPPYSSGGAFRGDRAQGTVAKYVNSDTYAYRPEFGGDSRDQRSYLAWSALWLNAARLAAIPGAPICMFTDWRQLPVSTDALQAGGWTWRNVATWHKPGVRMQKGRFSASAEYVLYGSNGPVNDGKRSPQNVHAVKIDKDRDHIAQKPVAVMDWVLGVVPSSAVVLDPFAGSGSTLVAAKAQGHRCIAVEADERYCEVIARRLSQGVLDFGGDAA